ncbi:YfhO family protein [Embleya sp. NPDC050493]|uniref:YfhO family protein n=1 Tax=Embleya sp. NPDC050493 TaxID=3363989 RepID=UPI0037B784FE
MSATTHERPAEPGRTPGERTSGRFSGGLRRLPGVRLWGRPDVAAPVLAFVATFSAYLIAWITKDERPFGDKPKGLNDLANQYVPFHLNLWDLAHGDAAGDFLFNWRSGFGTQFLSDYHTYLGNPFSLLAILVPRGSVDIVVFLVAPLTMGLAAAMMTVYLKRLSPGAWWMRATLGASYGLCGWALSDASYIPMWMWGLVSLPMLGIAMEWCLEGRRWVSSALLVAVAWMGNYYTGMMATLAAAILLLIRMATTETDWPQRLRAALRAGTAVGVGVMLTMPLLLPSYLSSKAAQPTQAGTFSPERTEVFIAGMLPSTHLWGGRPRLYIASLGLILALAFVVNRAIPPRTRLVWTGSIIMVAASFQWAPTQYVWHGLAVPNGNPYREAFVFSGLLVVVAWMCLTNKPRLLPMAGALGVLVLVTFLVRNADDFGKYTWWAVLGGGAISLGALSLVVLANRQEHPRSRRVLMGLAAVAMVGIVVGESAMSTAVADTRRARERWAKPVATSGANLDAKRAALRAVDGWPRYRTDPGPQYFAYNEPLRSGGEGPEYYSSYATKTTAEALDSLGYPSGAFGRTLFGNENPVTDAIFSIGARVSPEAAAPGRFETRRYEVPPLVTVRPEGPVAGGTAPADTVWGRHEQALGGAVYTVPEVKVTGGETNASFSGTGPWRLKPRPGKTVMTFTAQCTPGSGLFWYSPAMGTKVTGVDGRSAVSGGGSKSNRGGVLDLGLVPQSGQVKLTVAPSSGDEIPRYPVGCLDFGKLRSTVAGLRASAATHVSAGGHTFEATLPKGSRGTAVVGVMAVDGWVCSQQGGSEREPGKRDGRIAIALKPGTDRIACTFTPPGLRPGLAAAGVGLIALLAVPGTVWWRNRRDTEGVGEPSPTTAEVAGE